MKKTWIKKVDDFIKYYNYFVERANSKGMESNEKSNNFKTLIKNRIIKKSVHY